MSVAFVFSGIVSALVSGCVYFAIRKMHITSSPTVTARITATVLLPLLCLAFLPVMAWVGESDGYKLSTADLARRSITLPIPPEASDIDFFRHYHQKCFVDFTINEMAFRKWVLNEGWELKNLEVGEWVYPIDHQRPSVEVAKGYVVHTIAPGDDMGVHLIYDRATNRAYYRFSSF